MGKSSKTMFNQAERLKRHYSSFRHWALGGHLDFKQYLEEKAKLHALPDHQKLTAYYSGYFSRCSEEIFDTMQRSVEHFHFYEGAHVPLSKGSEYRKKDPEFYMKLDSDRAATYWKSTGKIFSGYSLETKRPVYAGLMKAEDYCKTGHRFIDVSPTDGKRHCCRCDTLEETQAEIITEP